MVGGRFQDADTADFSSAVDLFTISEQSPGGVLTTESISSIAAFRHVRYVGPESGYGNVAEVQSFGR